MVVCLGMVLAALWYCLFEMPGRSREQGGTLVHYMEEGEIAEARSTLHEEEEGMWLEQEGLTATAWPGAAVSERTAAAWPGAVIPGKIEGKQLKAVISENISMAPKEGMHQEAAVLHGCRKMVNP